MVEERAGGGLGGGRENGMMNGGGRERERGLAAGGLGDGGARSGRAPSSFLLLLNFIFTACEKFHKSQFHFSFPPLPPVFARHGTAGLPHPGSNSNRYVPITFSFCL